MIQKRMSEPLSEDARMVLAFIRDHPARSMSDIAINLNTDRAHVWASLRQLMDQRLIELHFSVPEDRQPRIPIYYPC